MAKRGSFWTSGRPSTLVLTTTILIAALTVHGKKSDQQDVPHLYKPDVEFRSEHTSNENENETVPASTRAATQLAKFANTSSRRLTGILNERAGSNASAPVKISERIFLGLAVTLFKSVVSYFAQDYLTTWQGNHTCYRNVCFFPQYGLGIKEIGGPRSPDQENITFLFFDNISSPGTVISETTLDDFFKNFHGDISKPLAVIVHGLNGSRHSPWANTLRMALFENVNCNVMQVDWQERARFPHYAMAASSAPLVGVLLSFLLQKIIETSNCSLHPDNVHLVGFSLGAHAAGVCGRHFLNTTEFPLGRITGLDPAGPLFLHSNVCLSVNDAQFVDVIHTNAGEFKDGRLGLNKSIGHVDFYPNGGYEQPGCSLLYDTTDPACSHKRAQGLFIESMFRNCSFMSYYCEHGWPSFTSGECTKVKNESFIGDMGYYSINATGRENQYLNTSGKSPYCLNHTKLWQQLEKDVSTQVTPKK